MLALVSTPSLEISIPAPARGRTAPQLVQNGQLADFNSRPREGANIVI